MHLNFGNRTSCRRRQGCSWLVATLALALLLCAEAVSSLDLGPIVRVAQCRSQCLKRHSLDGSCEWWRHGETGCNELCASFVYNNGVRLHIRHRRGRKKPNEKRSRARAAYVTRERLSLRARVLRTSTRTGERRKFSEKLVVAREQIAQSTSIEEIPSKHRRVVQIHTIWRATSSYRTRSCTKYCFYDPVAELCLMRTRHTAFCIVPALKTCIYLCARPSFMHARACILAFLLPRRMLRAALLHTYTRTHGQAHASDVLHGAGLKNERTCWQQCETLEKQWGSPKAAAPASASASSSNGSLQNQQQQRASCDDDEYKQTIARSCVRLTSILFAAHVFFDEPRRKTYSRSSESRQVPAILFASARVRDVLLRCELTSAQSPRELPRRRSIRRSGRRALCRLYNAIKKYIRDVNRLYDAICRTACEYRKSQVVEQYLPSMLPAPHRAPVNLAKNDVAVLMHKVRNEWRVFGYYPGTRAPSSLRHDEWIVAVVEDGGVVHFSWEEWLPTLDSLKEGPLFEATISWRDVDVQLKRQTLLEQKRFNDRVRQFFLEKYGEKVLEWRNQDEDTAIPEEVFRRFFFRRRDQDESGKRLDDTDNPEPSTLDSEDERNQSQVGKESFVVSWEPETGGLMGNQVADSNFAQISLLPGTKYLVRIASNEGPGSFPIEVDTRPSSIQVFQLKKNFVDAMVYPWAVLAASMCAAIIVCIAIIVKLCRRTAKEIEPLEVV
ncbi:unnamed protein product [Trichogramma brassicae]|uniref:Fibronectin type-III domain-containing protein n=1 Tax=Trichogramma brassicae TaxID=86971 RepID=A0A6H5ITM7_9HYME|nr:unnamed protein product [Trichogramma brassicae]